MSFEERLIKKKKAFLSGFHNGNDLDVLSRSRSQKKKKWARKNLPLLKQKYKDLPLLERAFNIIYIDHLSSNREDFELTYITPNKLQILSRNFCPYLEACKDLNLDTRDICKATGEQSFRDLAYEIDESLLFYRNYQNIRPYVDYCEEYLEITHQSEDLSK